MYPALKILSVKGNVGVKVDQILDTEDDLPQELTPDIALVIMDALVLKEAIILHKPSKTVFVADAGFKV